MHANLAQIETFYWVARLGSFHATARHLRLTQPSVSARVRELEASLGIKLFHRDHQRAEITAEGREILPKAEQMLRLADEIEWMSRGAGTLRGLLRLGAVESVALLSLRELLPHLRSRFPELRVEFTVDIGWTLNRKLNGRELDVAVLTDPQVDGHFVSEPVGPVQLTWMGSPCLDLPRRTLSPSDLAPLQIFTGPEPSSLYSVLRNWFRKFDLQPENVSTCNSQMVMAQLVAAGHGIAVLPPAILEAELRSGALQRLDTAPPVTFPALHVCYAHDRRSPGMRAIVAMIRETVERSGLVAAAPPA